MYVLATVSVCVGMADCTTDTVNRLKRKLQEVVQNAPQVCSLHFSVVSPTSCLRQRHKMYWKDYF